MQGKCRKVRRISFSVRVRLAGAAEISAGLADVTHGAPVRLLISLRHGIASFAYDAGEGVTPLPGSMDVSFLSDEACAEGWFTGTMTGSRLHADFAHFTLETKRLRSALC